MDPRQRPQRIAELFEAAVDLGPDARDAYLSEVCGDDAELRREVDALLALHSSDATVASLFPPLFTDAGSSLIGRRIGPYVVRRYVFAGGMGVVYEAEREDVGMRVALKLVRHGHLAAAEHLQRFLLERRLLARLEHPNIARLLDAGVTDDELPYLVMEYVEGTPLDRYCDEHRLTIEERLRLFLEVCDAVQYAHRNLIVHRDLKPSNILVTEQGVPKLLDFGVAKLLNPDIPGARGLTGAGLAPFTPAYASPEQLRAQPVTTQSDVYSLGVLLYELLSGHRPYHVATPSPVEAERIVSAARLERLSSVVMQSETLRHSDGSREEITPAAVGSARRTQPERLQRQLRGDLDTIVLEALQKEPERRYRSVQELAEDIGRYLDRRPLQAQPDSAWYRARRFAQRNRTVVSLGAAAVLSLVVGLAMAVWQAREASLQRDLGMQTAHTMMYELAEALSRMQGPTESQLGLLETAAEQFARVAGSRFAREEHHRQSADAQRVLSLTYLKLGDTERALRHAEAAAGMARRLAARNGASGENRLLLAGTLLELGRAREAGHRGAEALALFTEGLDVARPLAHERPDDARVLRALYLALSHRARRLADVAGSADEQSGLYREAFEVSERLVRLDGGNLQYQGFHATALTWRADLLYEQGATADACQHYDRALEQRRRAAGLASHEVEVRADLGNGLFNSAWCRAAEGRDEEAIRDYDEGIAVVRELAASDPGNLGVTSELIGGIGQLGHLFLQRSRLPEAAARYREALDVADRFLAQGRADPGLVGQTATLTESLARVELREGRIDEAAAAVRRAKELVERFRARDPGHIDYDRALAHTLIADGDVERQRTGPAAGVERYEQALALFRRVAEATGQPADEQMIGHAHHKLALGWKELGNPDRAREELQRGRDLLLDLRASGRLHDRSEGIARFLPAIEQELRTLDG